MTYKDHSKMGRDTLKRRCFCPKMGRKNGPLSHSVGENWLKKAHSVPLPYLAHNAQLCVVFAYLTRIYALFRANWRGRLYGEKRLAVFEVLPQGAGACPLALLGGDE